VLDAIALFRAELVRLTESGDLPRTADYVAINSWLVDTYEAWCRR
jgi:hypothetical protein